MSRTEKFLRNVAASGLLQVLNMIHGMITPRIMLAYYGSEMNGLVSSILQFISYFNIVEAGLSGAAIFALYKPLADKDNEKISGIITATKKMYYNAGTVFSVLVIVLAGVYPLYVTATGMGYWDMAILVAVLGMTGIIEFFIMAKYTALLTADQKLYIISVANGFKVVATVILIYLLAIIQTNIILIYAGVVCITITKTLLVMTYVNKNYKNIDYNSPKPDYDALQKRWDVLYLQVLNIIQHGTPVVLLTLFCKDLKIVSVYVIYNMVIHGVNSILGVFMNGLQAGFGELIAKNEQDKLRKAYSEFEFIYYNLIGVVFMVTYITIQPFIRLYTDGINDIDYNVPLIAILFVINALLYSIKTPQGMLTLSAGLYREQRWQITIQGMLALIVGACLVTKYEIIGVVVGLMVSNIFRDLEIPYFVSKSLISNTHYVTYRRMAILICTFTIGALFSNIIQYDILSYFDWIIFLVFAGIYSITLFSIVSLCTDKKTLRMVIARLKNKKSNIQD